VSFYYRKVLTEDWMSHKQLNCHFPGDVFYRSKFLQSETYKKNTAANRIVVSEFGTMVYPDPCKNIFSK